MERAALVEVAKRLLHYAETGTTASHPDGPLQHPIATYTDPAQFALEKERIFGRFPQLLGLSCDLPEPGSYSTHDGLPVPILAVRGCDGRVRAFLNSCAHRSARLLDGSGTLRGGIVCPYHAWAYDLDGRLSGVHKAETFGPVDAGRHGLVELPCEEKHGFVYAAPAPDATFSIDEHLGDLAPELGSWELGRATFIDSHEWRLRTNWKLALDTFCEGYHFGPLHAKTIARFALTNCASYDRYGKHGEHHRLGFPNQSLLSLRGRPEAEWGDPLEHFSFVHFLFPNISLLVSPDGVELFQLFPGERVDEHVTRYRLYLRKPVDTDERRRRAQSHFAYIRDVVDGEDYRVSAGVQRSFAAGLRTHTTFGRNEPALIDMHRTFRRMAST